MPTDPGANLTCCRPETKCHSVVLSLADAPIDDRCNQ
jgi:hypothetical protein